MDISNLLEVEVKEGKASELADNGEIADYKNIPDFSIRDIASVRFRKLHCTACDLHIGSAPAEAHNMHEHPVLHVLLCTACRNFYGDGTFEQGDDATDMFCRWCANGGNLYCCSYCSNTFCYNCIKRNFDPMIRKKIERDEKWKCFVCNPSDLYTARAACWALLQHVQTVTRILQSDRKMSAKEIEAKMNLDESQCCPHRNKRKRLEAISEEETNDETLNVPKRKRRKYLNAKRRKRVIKLEMNDVTSVGGTSLIMRNDERSALGNESLGNMGNLYFVRSEGTNNDKGEGEGGGGGGGAGGGGEEEDEDEEEDKLSSEELPLAVRQRNRRLREESANLKKFAITDDEIPAPLLECDQTMIEGAESLSFGGPNPEPFGGGITSIGISAVPMVNLMRRPPTGPLTRGGKTHRLIRGVGGTPVLVRKIAPKIPAGSLSTGVQCLPMVTIPSLNHMQPGNCLGVIQAVTNNSQDSQNSITPSIRTIAPFKKSVNTRNTTSNSKRPEVLPSVIEIDSDSDEPVVLNAPGQENGNSESEEDRTENYSTVTYPVRPDDGYMTILTTTYQREDRGQEKKNGYEREEENRIERSNDRRMEDSTKSIDDVLEALTKELKKVMESAIEFSSEKELLVARAKTRSVNRSIKRTVAELTRMNDNLVRSYHAYKRERTKDKTTNTQRIILEPKEKSIKLTSLDMECIRESEPENEEVGEEGEDDDDEEENNDFWKIKLVKSSRKRIDRCIEVKPKTRNKFVQVNDFQSRDYDKSIGYSLLLKAEYDSKRQRTILKPVKVADENFGKYEEEFINYLQFIEDNGIETEESRDIRQESRKDRPTINELIDNDLSAMIDSAAASPEGFQNFPQISEENLLEENVEIVDEHVEVLTAKSVSSEESRSSNSCESEDENSKKEKPEMEKEQDDTGKKEETEIDENSKRKDSNDEKETNDTNRESPKEIRDSSVEEIRRLNSPMSNQYLENKKEKKTIEEETVLAVRALIDQDNDKESDSKPEMPSWKSIDSDDECTILN